MQQDFQANLPLSVEEVWEAFVSGWRHPAQLLEGLPFSLTLLTILLAHEFGHFLTCVHYRIDASLPYFLPAPVLTGTFGAFIRIRAPIYFKRMLFDVAVGGPLAGFVFLLPALAIGVAYSKVIPGIESEGAFRFGTPLLLKILELAIFPGVASSDIYLHPVARAAWVGGAGDGLESASDRAARWRARALFGGGKQAHGADLDFPGRPGAARDFLLAMVVSLGGAAVLRPQASSRVRFGGSGTGADRKLAWLMLLLFVLCFTPAPITENPGF